MPRNSTAWVDLRIHLIVIAGLLCTILIYNRYIAFIGLVLLISLYIYDRERCVARQKALESYYRDIARNVNELSNYAIEYLPIGILVTGKDERVKWCNNELGNWLGEKPAIGVAVKNFMDKLIINSVWGQDGIYTFSQGDRVYEVRHRPVWQGDKEYALMVFYLRDITTIERMKEEKRLETPVLSYIQIDNYDEVLQGLNEIQRTEILGLVNSLLDDWARKLGAFLRKVSDDTYIAVLNHSALNQLERNKFDILDKVKAIQAANKFPVTLSLGVAEAEGLSLEAVSERAQAGLDLALGRGGDQVAVDIAGKKQFYGGKAKAVEKHTRVKARVVAHALNEIIDNSDMVLIMGHHNEDFDSLGAAMGVACMAKHMKKEVHIILSDMSEGIDKFIELMRNDEEYKSLFISTRDINLLTSLNPVLFVVDTHIPYLTAASALLERIDQVIVIDHHRRSEHFVENPLLVYIEPASSSTSELVTELLMYFSDNIVLSRLDATALYAGMVVDTKNFAVQTGVRTFDAAGYLRRSGADPVMVRHLFRTDYESSLAKAKTLADSEFFKCGLIVAVCPDNLTNAQVIAAQIADSMLRIENVRMSLVLFYLEHGGGIGISARSTGEINVQMIMEAFGGGGHQNVAGAQVKDADLESIKQKAIELSVKFIEESDGK